MPNDHETLSTLQRSRLRSAHRQPDCHHRARPAATRAARCRRWTSCRPCSSARCAIARTTRLARARPLRAVEGARRPGAVRGPGARGYFSRECCRRCGGWAARCKGTPRTSCTPGIEASTGSLGQGLSVAIGMALAAKLDGDKFRVYSMIGDGESQEGQIWEAAMSARSTALDNLCVILDHNKGQIDGFVEDVMSLEPIADKWRRSTGTWSPSTDTTTRRSGGAGRGARDQGQADVHPREDHERERRDVHRKRDRLAREAPSAGAAGASRDEAARPEGGVRRDGGGAR